MTCCCFRTTRPSANGGPEQRTFRNGAINVRVPPTNGLQSDAPPYPRAKVRHDPAFEPGVPPAGLRPGRGPPLNLPR